MNSTAKQMDTCSRKRLPFLTDTQICKDDDTRKTLLGKRVQSPQTVGMAYSLVNFYHDNKQKIKESNILGARRYGIALMSSRKPN